VILAARDPDFVGAETDVNQEHDHDGDPVVKLSEDDIQRSNIAVHPWHLFCDVSSDCARDAPEFLSGVF
jgi:hypothetical protein